MECHPVGVRQPENFFVVNFVVNFVDEVDDKVDDEVGLRVDTRLGGETPGKGKAKNLRTLKGCNSRTADCRMSNVQWKNGARSPRLQYGAGATSRRKTNIQRPTKGD